MFRIASIHHYCNRWCARCSLKTMCGFYQAKEQGTSIEAQQWSENIPEPKVKNEFQELDFSKLDQLEEALLKKEDQGDFDPNQSNLLSIYDQWQNYYGQVLTFVNQDWELEKAKQSAYVEGSRFFILWNAREFLLHYRNYVGPKLHRALGGLFDAGGEIPLQSDWNGSAKAILLVLEDLEIIVEKLVIQFPENQVLKTWQICHHDFKLQMEATFPKHAHFIRPGFDQF